MSVPEKSKKIRAFVMMVMLSVAEGHRVGSNLLPFGAAVKESGAAANTRHFKAAATMRRMADLSVPWQMTSEAPPSLGDGNRLRRSLQQQRASSTKQASPPKAFAALSLNSAQASDRGGPSAFHSAPMLRSGSRLGVRGAVPKMVALPTLPEVAAVCTLPTCLGFWKSEYGVSYAYGAATAIMGALVLRAASTSVAAMHAAALLMFGLRLNSFLLWRELTVEALREMRERIEARAMKKGSRWKRAPFVLSCSLLYACLAAPIMVTSTTAAHGLAIRGLVALEWAGLLLAATGDLVKSYVKAKKGATTLVTSGPYKFFRHPNYSGEQILWTANMVAGFAAAATGGMNALKANAGWLSASVFGWAGIFFVLAQATANLEKKQSARSDPEYLAWKERTWGGIAVPAKTSNSTSNFTK